MTARLFDSASPWDSARLEQVKAHGGVAVSVYIRGNPGGFRHATAADVALARSMGLGVLPNWESTADFFRTATRDQAHAAGLEALAACRALGFPEDGTVSVAFSFDYQMAASSYPAAAAQLTAVQDGLGVGFRATAYAQSGFIAYLATHGFGDRGHWLMASTWGLAYDIGQPCVAVVQSHGAAGDWIDSPVIGTDINTITRPGALGAWWPDNSPYGGNMALTLSSADVDLIKHSVVRPQTATTPAETVGDALRAALDVKDQLTAVQKQLAALQALIASKQAPAISGTLHLDGDVTVTPK